MHYPKVKGTKVVFPYINYGYTLITFEQFKEHFMETPNIIPDVWYIEVTEENKDILSEWRGIPLSAGSVTGMVKWNINGRKTIEKGHLINGKELKGEMYEYSNQISTAFFKKYIMKQEEFILPPTWWIRVTEENVEVLRIWYGHRILEPGKHLVGMYQDEHDNIPKQGFNPVNSRDDFGQEITFEQFKKYVLMQNEEIIGYRLIKPEYAEIASEIGSGNKYVPFFKLKDEITKDGHIELSTKDWESTIENLKKSGVLDIWFEPIVKKLRPPLPKINNYTGKDEGDYLVYGCAKLNKNWFTDSENRNIHTFKTNNNVTVSAAQVKEIREYLNWKE